MKLFNNILLLSAVTFSLTIQCMLTTKKLSHQKKVCTIFSLNSPNNRIDLAVKLAEKFPHLEYPLYQKNHKHTYKKDWHKVKIDKNLTIRGYSLIGFATMALQENRSTTLGFDQEYYENYLDYTPYHVRKKFIKILRNRGVKITDKDRELAFIMEKEEGITSRNGKSHLLNE